MEESVDQLYFEEEQRFPLWIRATALLPVVVLGYPVILLWLEGSRFVLSALILSALALFFLLLAHRSLVRGHRGVDPWRLSVRGNSRS